MLRADGRVLVPVTPTLSQLLDKWTNNGLAWLFGFARASPTNIQALQALDL